MSIASSCILLGGVPFLTQHGQALSVALTAYMGNVRERGMLLLFPVMDIILVQHPQDGVTLLLPALQVRILSACQAVPTSPARGSLHPLRSELLCHCLQKLLALILSGSEGVVVVANGLGLFARIALMSRPAFEGVLGSCATAGILPPAGYTGMPAAPQAERLLGAFSGTHVRSESLHVRQYLIWACMSVFDVSCRFCRPVVRAFRRCGIAAGTQAVRAGLGLPAAFAFDSASTTAGRCAQPRV